MKTEHLFFALAAVLALAACGSDDDGNDTDGEDNGEPVSLYEGTEEFGEQQDLSDELTNAFLIEGSYMIESYTSDTARDWNGDGEANIDLLLEIPPCMVDNVLEITTEYYEYFLWNRGVLCDESEDWSCGCNIDEVVGGDVEGVLVMGDTSMSYNEERGTFSLAFFRIADRVFPRSLYEVELYTDESGNKTIIGKEGAASDDPVYSTHTVVLREVVEGRGL